MTTSLWHRLLCGLTGRERERRGRQGGGKGRQEGGNEGGRGGGREGGNEMKGGYTK